MLEDKCDCTERDWNGSVVSPRSNSASILSLQTTLFLLGLLSIRSRTQLVQALISADPRPVYFRGAVA